MFTQTAETSVEICGALNKYNKPCQRIGNCPFHKKKNNNKYHRNQKLDEENTENVFPIIPLIKKKENHKKGWTPCEHLLFLKGLQLCGKGSWKSIEKIVKTRNSAQIQAHANRYYKRIQQPSDKKVNRSVHDFDLSDLEDLEKVFANIVNNVVYDQNNSCGRDNVNMFIQNFPVTNHNCQMYV